MHHAASVQTNLTSSRSLHARAVALALVVATLGGCASAPEPASSAISTPPLSAPAHPLTPWIVGGSGIGVHTRTIAVRNTGDALAAALDGIAHDPLTIDDALRSAWERSGLRLYMVSEADALTLQDTLIAQSAIAAANAGVPESSPAILGSVEQLVINQGAQWVPIVRGPAITRRRVVAMHDARIPLAPGPLRLIARCWATPPSEAEIAAGADADTPIMQVQFIPQLLDGSRPRDASALDPDLMPTPSRLLTQDQGLLITRLKLSIRIPKGRALVIAPWPLATPTPADPATNEPPTGPGLVTRGGPDAPKPTPKDAASAGADLPPATTLFDPVQTLGQELLSIPNARKADPTAGYRVLVFIPRPPSTLDLFAPNN